MINPLVTRRLDLLALGMYETLYFIDRLTFHKLIYIYGDDYRPFK